MRKTLSVVFALALLFPVGALAQTTSTATSSASSTADAHKAALQAKLAKIKDAAKRTATEKADADIAALNKQTTDQLLSALDQITSVLNRAIAKTNELQLQGKNISSVQLKVTAAQNAIASARTKVQAQAAKTYSINVTTDAKLKGAVQAVRNSLRVDLMAAQAAVKAARKAMQDTLTALANVGGQATSTVTTSSTKK